MDYKIGEKITALYKTSVYKAAIHDWRTEWVEATLTVVSPGYAVVVEADLDPAKSRRQSYHVDGVRKRETGKRKRISTLRHVEVIE